MPIEERRRPPQTARRQWPEDAASKRGAASRSIDPNAAPQGYDEPRCCGSGKNQSPAGRQPRFMFSTISISAWA